MNKKIITTLFALLGIGLLFSLASCTKSELTTSKSDTTTEAKNVSENKNTMLENTKTHSGDITSEFTFKVSDAANVQKVTFKNRYGIELVGNLYVPKNTGSGKLQAIAISGPFGAVKEQASGLYANQMAERGFVALAFDPSYNGESGGGEPRNVASPEINTEDFSAAVDYLGKSELVDREKIGIIGICGFGGFALNAASADKRIKAVATSVMYDMSRIMANGYNDVNTDANRVAMLDQYAKDRWNYIDGTGASRPPEGIMTQEQINSLENPVMKMYMQYYKTARGYNERSVNSSGNRNPTNLASFFNFPLMSRIKYISPSPVLIIAGENAHSRYFSEDAYKNASEPKELMIIPGAIHTDLYDGGEKNYIPFEKLDTFFKTNLK